MRILAERALDNDALLRLPLYSRSRSRSNDSVEKAKGIAVEGLKEKKVKGNPKKKSRIC